MAIFCFFGDIEMFKEICEYLLFYIVIGQSPLASQFTSNYWIGMIATFSLLYKNAIISIQCISYTHSVCIQSILTNTKYIFPSNDWVLGCLALLGNQP